MCLVSYCVCGTWPEATHPSSVISACDGSHCHCALETCHCLRESAFDVIDLTFTQLTACVFFPFFFLLFLQTCVCHYASSFHPGKMPKRAVQGLRLQRAPWETPPLVWPCTGSHASCMPITSHLLCFRLLISLSGSYFLLRSSQL